MTKLRGSIAFRLSIICGMLIMLPVILLCAVFYFGTASVLENGADEKILNTVERLARCDKKNGPGGVSARISQALTDGVDSDTEIYLLSDPTGQRLAGNITGWKNGYPPLDRLVEGNVIRDGRPSTARIFLTRLTDGSLLAVGRDMRDLREIDALVWHAIIAGSMLALLLSIIGAFFFRLQIEHRIGAIRHAARQIEAGDLTRRVPVAGDEDEFSRLGADLNRMLNRIEQLMDGVRHVSDMIAHNMRTPLGRIRNSLEEALRHEQKSQRLSVAGRDAIEEIDRLTRLFENVLQIAEAESGMRRQHFAPVAIRGVVDDIVELYDAAAEEAGVTLVTKFEAESVMLGDRELLSSALANLLDNAFKYAGRSAVISIQASQCGNRIALAVHDNGPGIPPTERDQITKRFYRLGQEGKPGYGIGLAFVAAVVELHHGDLRFENAMPGLSVCMTFPASPT